MTRTADQMALDILLAGGPKADQRLAELAKRCHERLHGGNCPECGHHGPHDDNGEHGSDLTFMCIACGTKWDAEGL